MVRSVRTTLSGCRDMTPNVMPAMSPSSRLARPWCMSGTVVYVVCEVSPLTPPAKAITLAVTGVIESIIGHMVHCHSSGRVALSVSPAWSDRLRVGALMGATLIAPSCEHPNGFIGITQRWKGVKGATMRWEARARCGVCKRGAPAHKGDGWRAVGPCRRDTQSDPSRAVTVHHVAYNALNDTCDS